MALFALGLGMGLPLLAFGAFGSSVLPRSGPWLAAVNAMFGAIFLGLAISMLARIVPPPFSLAAWGIFAIGLGVFLGAFEQDALPSLARRIERTIGIAAAVYGIALVVGFASGASDPLRPLAAIATARPEHLEAPMPLRKVVNAQQLDRAIAEARAEHRPVLIGFSADWCSECKTIERYVLTDPRVLAQLRHVALIHIDVTRADAESYALMRRFQVAGPPTYLVLDAQNGGEGGGPDWRQVGDMTTGDLLRLVAHAKST